MLTIELESCIATWFDLSWRVIHARRRRRRCRRGRRHRGSFNVRERHWCGQPVTSQHTNMMSHLQLSRNSMLVCRLRCLIDLLPLIFLHFVASFFFSLKKRILFSVCMEIKCICNKFNWNVPPREPMWLVREQVALARTRSHTHICTLANPSLGSCDAISSL